MPRANPPRTATADAASSPTVSSAGIGLKARHYAELLQTQPSLGFLELHTENYMGEGGPPHRYLEALAERYPLSFHGVGLSLGGHEPLDPSWLRRWRTLLDRYAPALVSEHVAWSSFAGYAFHDLLPLPYSAETLDRLCQHIDQLQTQLGRQILIENPARYLDFHATEMSEAEFLVAAAQRSGCGLLLDLNNLYVSACNQGEDAFAALTQIPGPVVGEIHLAGHALQVIDGHEIRIDDHGSRVDEAVWDLYRAAIELIGPRPTLIEWDTDVPALASLLAEAQRADSVAGAAQNETLRHVAR